MSDILTNNRINLKCGVKSKSKGDLNRALLNTIPDKDWNELLKSAFTDALNGDKSMKQYFLDQKLGKAPAKIEHSGSVEHNYIKSIDTIKQQAIKLSNISITNDGISEDLT